MPSANFDTRERILNAAWKLLEADKAASVRMGDIAKEAGISRQALYLHFSTRAELLVATARYLDDVKNVDQRLAASSHRQRQRHDASAGQSAHERPQADAEDDETDERR